MLTLKLTRLQAKHLLEAMMESISSCTHNIEMGYTEHDWEADRHIYEEIEAILQDQLPDDILNEPEPVGTKNE